MDLNRRIETTLLAAFNEAEQNGEVIKNFDGLENLINKIRRIDPSITKEIDAKQLKGKIIGSLWGTSLFNVRVVPNGGKTSDQYFSLSEEGKYYYKTRLEKFIRN